MHKNIILVAETGSDITAALAAEKGIRLVPMHVQMGDVTYDDGAFPPEDVCAYYDRTGKCATTSASTPYDFTKAFDEIHEAYPEHHILYLAYSAITTCSFQNAMLASEERSYVTGVDTKHVSVGQGAVVRAVAKYLDTHPDCTTALDYYHQTLAALKILTEKYEITESPLTASGVTSTERWSWVDGAWPWQQGNGAQSRKERK